jgi:hypothetical protein
MRGEIMHWRNLSARAWRSSYGRERERERERERKKEIEKERKRERYAPYTQYVIERAVVKATVEPTDEYENAHVEPTNKSTVHTTQHNNASKRLLRFLSTLRSNGSTYLAQIATA